MISLYLALAEPQPVHWRPPDLSPAAVSVREAVRAGPVSIRRLALDLDYSEDTIRKAVRELGMVVRRSVGGRRVVG
jgi:hypothetical protein